MRSRQIAGQRQADAHSGGFLGIRSVPAFERHEDFFVARRGYPARHPQRVSEVFVFLAGGQFYCTACGDVFEGVAQEIDQNLLQNTTIHHGPHTLGFSHQFEVLCSKGIGVTDAEGFNYFVDVLILQGDVKAISSRKEQEVIDKLREPQTFLIENGEFFCVSGCSAV